MTRKPSPRMTHEELKAKILSTIQGLSPVRRRFLETSFSRYRLEVISILDYLEQDGIIKTTGKGIWNSPVLIELAESIEIPDAFENSVCVPRWKKEQQEKHWRDLGELAYYHKAEKSEFPRIGKPYSPVWHRCRNAWLAGWKDGFSKWLLSKRDNKYMD